MSKRKKINLILIFIIILSILLIRSPVPLEDRSSSSSPVYCNSKTDGSLFGIQNCEEGEIIGEVTGDSVEKNVLGYILVSSGLVLFLISTILLAVININYHLKNKLNK